MKKLLATLTLVVLAGAGCANPFAKPAYTNDTYGFSMDFDANVIEMRDRPEEDQPYTYLGLETTYFATLRLKETETEKPNNLAAFYAVPKMDAEAFKKVIEAGKGMKVVSTSEETVNNVTLTTVVSTTEAGDDKTHYLFDHDGQTVIVSEYIYQHDAFAPILATLRAK